MDADTVLRMVKYWLVLGYYHSEESDKKPSHSTEEEKASASHKSMWSIVEQTFRDGSLPTHTELDWLSTRPASMHKPSGEEQGGGIVSTTPLAASAAPRTPPHVHEECQNMMQRGTIWTTTVEQRARNKKVPGITYIIPSQLTSALDWGYISPNLPAPQNYRWQGVADKWFLRPIYKGG